MVKPVFGALFGYPCGGQQGFFERVAGTCFRGAQPLDLEEYVPHPMTALAATFDSRKRGGVQGSLRVEESV